MEFILKQHKTDARNHMDYCAFAVRVHAKKITFLTWMEPGFLPLVVEVGKVEKTPKKLTLLERNLTLEVGLCSG